MNSVSFNAGPALVGNVAISQVNSDWNASSGYAQILNKPAITTYGLANDTTAGVVKTNPNYPITNALTTTGSITPSYLSTLDTLQYPSTQRTLPSTQSWRSVTYGNGVFVAVAYGSNVAATTSPDGITGHRELYL